MGSADDSHRAFAIQFNNAVWDELDRGELGPASPRDDRDRLLYDACAAAAHWRRAGDVTHQARAEHLIARVAVVAGYPHEALRHARRCLELVDGHPDVMADWDRGFALEALARAEAASGDGDGARTTYERARAAAAQIADDDDRATVEGELNRPPWFGVAPE